MSSSEIGLRLRARSGSLLLCFGSIMMTAVFHTFKEYLSIVQRLKRPQRKTMNIFPLRLIAVFEIQYGPGLHLGGRLRTKIQTSPGEKYIVLENNELSCSLMVLFTIWSTHKGEFEKENWFAISSANKFYFISEF